MSTDLHALFPLINETKREENRLRLIWQSIRAYLWSIIFLVVGVSILAMLMVSSIKPSYLATATLLIENKPTKLVSIDELYGIDGPSREYFNTQVAVLQSRQMMDRVVVALGLDEHSEFKPASTSHRFHWRDYVPDLVKELVQLGTVDTRSQDTPQLLEKKKRNGLIAQLQGQMNIWHVPASQLLKISFESYDPELSAQVANTMAEVYIASNLEARQNISSKSSSWLSERLSGLLEKLKISESRLQDYRERHHLVDVQGVNSIASKQLNELTTSLMQAQRERNEKRQLYEMVDRANKSMSALLAIPAILNSPVIQELQKLEATKEREMADLVQRYGPEHPRMISAKSDLSSARNNLQKQALMLADAIVQDYRIAASNASGVEQRFESVKKELQQINREEAELDVLQREVATNRQLYNLFLTRTKETDATGTVQANDIQALNARVIDPAIAPMAPNKPNKKQIVLFTALTTLVIAVLLALLSENMNDYIRSTDDIEQKLKLPCLGTVPLVVDKRWKKEAVTMGQLFINQDHSPFFESIRTVRAALILSEQERKFRVIAITSTVPREGKSTISANLSLAMSPMEKVLLIDGDLRRPSIAKIFGIDKDSPGLSNLINGTQPQSACLHDIPGTNLTVMPSGDQPPNPHVLLSSKVFQDLLKQLSERFDRVIIDTPPTHAVADSLIIGAIADANICVCHAESTPFPMIHTSIAHMRRTNVPIVGVVLNQFKSKRRHGYYYSSYYSYGGYNYSKKSGGTKGS